MNMSTPSSIEVDLHGLFKDNTSIDYTDYEYKEVVCQPSTVSGALAVFIPLLYSVGLVWGLLGNGLVLVILLRKRLNHSLMDIFILHLSLADSLLLLTLPLWAIDAVKGWIMGSELCKIAGALFKINFYYGIFLLACFSVNCYLSIVHGVKTFSNKRPLVVHSFCLMIWLLCLLLSIPDWMYLKSIPSSSKCECIHSYPIDSYHLGPRFPYIVSFVLAALVLLFCCSSIALKLRQDSQCQRRKTDRRRAAITAGLLLGFFIFWTPYSITFMVNTARPVVSSSSSVVDECDGRQWTASKITAIFGLLHCVINPVIYFCLAKEFRRRALNMIKLSACETNRNDGSLWDSGEVTGNASVQEEQGSLQPMNGIRSEMQNQDHDV